jgi:hypothetical protein
MCSKSSLPYIDIHVLAHVFMITIEPARPSAALPVSTDTTVDVTVLAGTVVTSGVAVIVATFPPWPGRTMFLMAT